MKMFLQEHCGNLLAPPLTRQIFGPYRFHRLVLTHEGKKPPAVPDSATPAQMTADAAGLRGELRGELVDCAHIVEIRNVCMSSQRVALLPVDQNLYSENPRSVRRDGVD